jgi:hypothetical protein
VTASVRYTLQQQNTFARSTAIRTVVPKCNCNAIEKKSGT